MFVFMQFGMLIEYLFEKFPNWQEIGCQAIGDLQVTHSMQRCNYLSLGSLHTKHANMKAKYDAELTIKFCCHILKIFRIK
jgi:hypothetical protein